MRSNMSTGSAIPSDATALDRALKAARRGVELKPQSAFGYHILFVVLFFRGENEAASAAAEKAIALNPYDVSMRADYGGRLIFAGQLDKGMEILRETVGVRCDSTLRGRTSIFSLATICAMNCPKRASTPAR